jgi:hypothetical protein
MDTGIVMRVRAALLIICSILFLHGCATSTSQKISLTAVTSRDQKVGDQETITSQKKHFISLSPYTELKLAKDKTIFMVGIKNCGKAPITLNCDDISVTFKENSGNGDTKKISLESLDDFLKDFKEEYSDSENKYIKSKLESIQLDAESSSSAVSGSDNMGDKVKDLKTRIETMRAQNQVIRERLPEFYLKSETIKPDNNYSGIVVCDTRTMNDKAEGNFQIAVSVDGEVHQFIFKRRINR